MTQEGIDYSRGGPLTSAQLKAAGKRFVGRYAVNDHSPNGRGITAAEYVELTAGGIDVFLYWESSEGWMRDGFAAGTQAAVNAQNNITAAGMPHDTPVYFACDYDAPPEDQHLIDLCLQGCAKVLGFERVGLYAGYWPLLRAKQNGTATWFCQTLAWSGGNLLEGVHLYQFDTAGNYINGVDVDLVRAYQDHYGQAADFAGNPVPTPTEPEYATPIAPWPKGTLGWKSLNGTSVYALVAEVEVTSRSGVQPLFNASPRAEMTGPKLKQGEHYTAIGSFRAEDGVPWNIDERGSRLLASKSKPRLPTKP